MLWDSFSQERFTIFANGWKFFLDVCLLTKDTFITDCSSLPLSVTSGAV